MADPAPTTPPARDPELGFPPPGEVLHRLRTQRGMSLRQVAAECGLSVSFLAALERGETDIALERLGRLAKVFDHDVGSFLGFSRGRATPHSSHGRSRRSWSGRRVSSTGCCAPRNSDTRW